MSLAEDQRAFNGLLGLLSLVSGSVTPPRLQMTDQG
jgi:hypothetical protein